VSSVAFNPDGTRLACGSDRDTIVWDLKTGKTIPDAPVPDWFRDAARSSDGRWAAAADDDRVHLVDLWEQIDPFELDMRLWATRFDLFWHSARLEQVSKGNDANWFAAVYHLNQLLERQPGNPGLLAQRRGLVAEAVKRDPRDDAALAAHARLLLAAGKLDEYRKACAALANVAGSFEDEALLRRLALACVLAPEPLKDLQPLLDAFRKTMSEKYPEDLRLYGGLLLRAGKAEQAVGYLLQARSEDSGAVYEDLLLALAYQQLKKPDDARRYLDRTLFILDRQPAAAAAFNLQAGCLSPLHAALGTQLSTLPDHYQRAVGWQGWIELQALRREAVKARRLGQ
jgi:tetratricopeptide (TPR) repeat protein